MLQQTDLRPKSQMWSWDKLWHFAIWLDASNAKSCAAMTLCNLTRAKKTLRDSKAALAFTLLNR
jgi:phosphatidylserine decarboxylase